MEVWIIFNERDSKSGKTKIVDVCAKNNPNIKLGEIKWFGRWRRYSFFPEADTVFEWECMRHISDRCENMTKEFSKSKKK